jgi:hypothetical protein
MTAVVYYLSGTAGGIRPVADNTTGDYPQVLGMASVDDGAVDRHAPGRAAAL